MKAFEIKGFLKKVGVGLALVSFLFVAVGCHGHRGDVKRDRDILAEHLMDAALYALSEQNDKIIATLQHVTDMYPDMAFPIFILAEQYRAKRDYAEAIRCYKRVIELRPDLVMAYSDLAVTYEGTKDYENAIYYYKHALDLTDKPEYLNDIARLYSEMSEYKKAIEYYERSLPRSTDKRPVLRLLAKEYLNKGDLERAIYYYDKTLELSSADTNARYKTGIYKLIVGDRTGGLESLLILVGNSMYTDKIASVLDFIGDADMKRRFQDRAKIEESAKNAGRGGKKGRLLYVPAQGCTSGPVAEFCYFAGSYHSKKGDYDRGIRYYTEAINRDPNFACAYNGLAWFYVTVEDLRYRNTSEALKLATKAAEFTNYEMGCIVDTLAEAYFQAGDAAKARELEAKALKLEPYNTTFKRHMEKYKKALQSKTKP